MLPPCRIQAAMAGLLAAALAVPLAGQMRSAGVAPNPDARMDALHAAERMTSRRDDHKDDASVERRQRELLDRLATFANAWNGLMRGAEKGVWNAKEAKKARKAFEKLVHCGGWIEDVDPVAEPRQ